MSSYISTKHLSIHTCWCSQSQSFSNVPHSLDAAISDYRHTETPGVLWHLIDSCGLWSATCQHWMKKRADHVRKCYSSYLLVVISYWPLTPRKQLGPIAHHTIIADSRWKLEPNTAHFIFTSKLFSQSYHHHVFRSIDLIHFKCIRIHHKEESSTC